MDKIRFPFRVKVNGAYYAPGEVIQVENADEFVRQGAEVVSRLADEKEDGLFSDEAREPPKRPGRPKKSQ